jgi:hypothetical protein
MNRIFPKGIFGRKLSWKNLILMYCSVILMITITWYSAVQEAMAVEMFHTK